MEKFCRQTIIRIIRNTKTHGRKVKLQIFHFLKASILPIPAKASTQIYFKTIKKNPNHKRETMGHSPLSLIASFASNPELIVYLGRIQKIPQNKADKLRIKTKKHLKLNWLESLPSTIEHPWQRNPEDLRLGASWLCCWCRFCLSIFPISKASGLPFTLSIFKPRRWQQRSIFSTKQRRRRCWTTVIGGHAWINQFKLLNPLSLSKLSL